MAFTKWYTRRRVLGTTAAMGAATLVLPGKAPAQGGNKPFDGETINVSSFSGPYPKMLESYVPEFTEQTGITVNYELPAFPVYNQRADLELSMQGSAYDVLNVTFIYTARWIGANWFTPLEDFLNDPNKTPEDWNFGDFLPGTLTPMKNQQGQLFGIPWIADTMMMAAYRMDLMDKMGIKMPTTFEELEEAAKATNGAAPGLAGYANENHHGWTWPPFLQGYGGDVFVDPPDNLMPALNSPAGVEAGKYFANLLSSYGPDGILSWGYDQLVAASKRGAYNLVTFNHAFIIQAGQDPNSVVKDTCAFGLFPAGPEGAKPGVAIHAFGIPVGSRKKDAAWEFIKWSLSRDMMQRVMLEKGYGSVTRNSLIETPEFKERMMVNGYDTAKLYVDTIDLAAEGYMTYRTIDIYPQVDKQIDKAIENIASGQYSPEEAMNLAQENAIADVRRAGKDI